MGYGSCPGGISTCNSSHIHWPEVVKLKKWPSIAKLFTNETRRPVGWPESVQLPVSSRTVFSNPTSTTSPPTPLISTQSPTRMPLRPISTNHPKNATMKSFMATVSPAPARPRIVVVCVGMPTMMKMMAIAPTTCAANFTTARSVSTRLFSADMPVNRCSIRRSAR